MTRPDFTNARWGLAAALFIAGGATLWTLSRGAQAADERARPARGGDAAVAVTTAPVVARDVPIVRSGIGTVTPAQTVTVRPRVDGQLDRVAFAEGQDVAAGQLLARIDPRTFEAQLAQVRAQRAKDQAQLENAQADLRRYAALAAQDAATQQQLDTQRALVTQLQAVVRTDDAQVDAAQVQLGYTTIAAPIPGRVGARLVDAGNIVHASDAGGLVVINQVDPISVVFTLPEDAVQQINEARSHDHGALTVAAYPRDGDTLLASGRLVLVNNQIDAVSGTISLKAAFANPQHRLWPGQFVSARLMIGHRHDALTIPAAAVLHGQDGAYAWVIDPQTTSTRRQPIVVAAVQDGLAVVERGLEAGQRVVTDGQYKLKPGSHIVEPGHAGSRHAQVAEAGARP